MSLQNIEFYRRRAAEELDLADAATHPIAAKIHSELAFVYAKQAAVVDMGEESRWPGILQNKGR